MSDRIRFDGFNLVARDVEAAVDFYRRLGLDIPDTDAPWQVHHRSAQGGDGLPFDIDSIPFAGHWDTGWTGGMGVLGFSVDSRARVDEVHGEMVGAGYRSQQPPVDAFWGARYAVVEDPDGNAVGIMSPVDPARKSEPGFPGPADPHGP